MSYNRDDVDMVIVAPDGTWLSTTMRDGRQLTVGEHREELRDLQKTLEGRSPPDPRATVIATARNEDGEEQPSADVPWLPKVKRKRPKPTIKRKGK